MVKREFQEVTGGIVDNVAYGNYGTDRQTITNKQGFNLSIEKERQDVEHKLFLNRKRKLWKLRENQDHPFSLIDEDPEKYIRTNYIGTKERKEFLRTRNIEPYKKHWLHLKQKVKRVNSSNTKVIRDKQPYMSSLSIHNDKLYMGSRDDLSINVWNLHRGGKINRDVSKKDLKEVVDFKYIPRPGRCVSMDVRAFVFHGDNLIAGMKEKLGLMSFNMNDSDFDPDNLLSDEDEEDYAEDKNRLSYGDTFGNHVGNVNALIFHGELLFSASEDNTIRIHKVSKRNKSGWHCEATLGIPITPFYCLMESKRDSEKRAKQGHIDSVTCLAIHDNKLYSGSTDGTIRVWNTVKPYKCFAVLKCPQEYSVRREKTPEVLVREIEAYQYDTEEYRVIEKTDFKVKKKREREQIECLLIHNNKLFVGSDDSLIHVFDTKTDTFITSLSGHSHETTFSSEGYLGEHLPCGVRCMVVHNNKLYSGGDDWNIRVWNTKTFKPEKILELHYASVISLAIHENKLFSSSGSRVCVTSLSS